MKKFVMLFCCAAAGILTLPAATALHVELNDGSRASYLLSERPRVSFEGADVVFTTSGATASWPRSAVARMSFGEAAPSAIGEIGADGFDIVYDGTEISAPGRRIELYDLAGRRIASSEGSLSLAGLQHGIYIAKSENHTLKIKR